MKNITYNDIEDWPEFLKELKSKNLREFREMNSPWLLNMWNGLQDCKDGEVCVRIVDGGNEYMKTGDSRCGFTPGIQIGIPIVIVQPNGLWYKGGTIERIDWDKEIFWTQQSTYSFHFVRR